jgi:hypothetical protein
MKKAFILLLFVMLPGPVSAQSSIEASNYA